MAELSPEEVRRIAAALGIPIGDDDLDDVTFRVNATLEHLVAALGQGDDPSPVPGGS